MGLTAGFSFESNNIHLASQLLIGILRVIQKEKQSECELLPDTGKMDENNPCHPIRKTYIDYKSVFMPDCL